MQTVQTTVEGIVEEARYIASLRPENMYAKIPVTREGLRAIKLVKQEGIKCSPPRSTPPTPAFLLR